MSEHTSGVEVDDSGQAERLAELLTTQSVDGLTLHEERELEELLSATNADERALWHRTIAAAELAMIAEVAEQPLTAELRTRLIGAAMSGAGRKAPALVGRADDEEQAGRVGETMRLMPSAASGRYAAVGGWLAAAAALALLSVVLLNRPSQIDPASQRLAQERRQRESVDMAKDVVRLAFEPGVDELKGVKGEVVWSDESQAGYMKFSGLAVNDPKVMQYQLWIVDPTRDKHPVDGGVFDVTSAGEVMVKINRAVEVRKPGAFAITREKPGGVVVSAGPLVLVAKASG